MMKKQIEFCVRWTVQIILICFPILGFAQIRTVDIKYLKIGNVELANDTLFLCLRIRPNLQQIGIDTTSGTYHKQVLSSLEKDKYLKLIDDLDILSIQSNNQATTGHLPFVIAYSFDNQIDTIRAYVQGMSPSEVDAFEKYNSTLGDIINNKSVTKKFLAALPDGQYQVGSIKKYQIYLGNGWESWEKKEGSIKKVGLPLVLLNGKEVDIDKIDSKKIKTFELINPQKAKLLYGSKGKNGALVFK